MDFPDSSVGKESAFNAGDPSWIPELGRSSGEGIGYPPVFLGFPCGSADKESSCNAGYLGLIPGLRRCPGERKGYPVFWPILSMGSPRVVCNSMASTHSLSYVGAAWLRYSVFHFCFQMLIKVIST